MDLKKLKKGEIEELLKKRCISIPTCGSGKKGGVLKQDLIDAANLRPKVKDLSAFTTKQLKDEIKNREKKEKEKALDQSVKTGTNIKDEEARVSKMKLKELKEEYKKMRIDLPKKGSGKNKGVLKKDLVKTLLKFISKSLSKGYVPKYSDMDMYDIGEKYRRGLITTNQADVNIDESWPDLKYKGEKLIDSGALSDTVGYFGIRGLGLDLGANEVMGIYDLDDDHLHWDLLYDTDANEYIDHMDYAESLDPDQIIFFSK